MAQIAIYLDDEVLAKVKAATKAAGSAEPVIAEAIKLRMSKEWPVAFQRLAGAWPEFPTVEEIRNQQTADVPRERL